MEEFRLGSLSVISGWKKRRKTVKSTERVNFSLVLVQKY